MLGFQEFYAREALPSEIKMHSNGNTSLGTSFQIAENEIFLRVGVRDTSDVDDKIARESTLVHSTQPIKKVVRA